MFPVHESVMGTDRYGKKHFPICVDEFSCRYARDRISVLERNSVFHFGEGEPRNRRVSGSFQSSFSDMAAQIGGVPLEILKL